MIKIELATQNELDRVKEIAEACAKNMIENNIFQWNDKYPSREIFKEDIKNKSLYVSKINQEVVGCIMFSSFKWNGVRSALSRVSCRWMWHQCWAAVCSQVLAQLRIR